MEEENKMRKKCFALGENYSEFKGNIYGRFHR
jgi:hypothetical protein